MRLGGGGDVSLISPPVCPLILFFSECFLVSSNSGQSCWVKLVSLTDQPLPLYRGLSDCPSTVFPLFFLLPLRPSIWTSCSSIPLPSILHVHLISLNGNQDALTSPIPHPHLLSLFCKYGLLKDMWWRIPSLKERRWPPFQSLSSLLHPLCPIIGQELTMSWKSLCFRCADLWFQLYPMTSGLL